MDHTRKIATPHIMINIEPIQEDHIKLESQCDIASPDTICDIDTCSIKQELEEGDENDHTIHGVVTDSKEHEQKYSPNDDENEQPDITESDTIPSLHDEQNIEIIQGKVCKDDEEESETMYDMNVCNDINVCNELGSETMYDMNVYNKPESETMYDMNVRHEPESDHKPSVKSEDTDKQNDAIIDSKIYKCKNCGCKFATLHSLTVHQFIHRGNKNKSIVCNQLQSNSIISVKFIGNFESSEISKTKVKRGKIFKCKKCDFKSNWLKCLKVHMRTHTEEKSFKCTQCDYSSNKHGGLKQHMRTHTGEKPYKCTQCDYRCSRQYSLKTHMRTHTGEKPYSCTQCGHRFGEKVSLNRHMRTHIAEKPYKCSQCDYRGKYK